MLSRLLLHKPPRYADHQNGTVSGRRAAVLCACRPAHGVGICGIGDDVAEQVVLAEACALASRCLKVERCPFMRWGWLRRGRVDGAASHTGRPPCHQGPTPERSSPRRLGCCR